MKKSFKLLIAFCVVAVLFVAVILFWGHATIQSLPVSKNESSLRIVSMNVMANNILDDKLQNEILKARPDIIVIVEWTGNNLDLNKFREAGYVINLNHPRKLVYGLCILSKYIGDALIIESPIETPCAFPMSQFRFKWLNETVSLLAFHAPPPVPLCGGTTNDYIIAVSEWITDGKLNRDFIPGSESDPVIIAGDFNSISFDRGIRKIYSKGLTDIHSQYDFTSQTWKPFVRFPYIAKIDYIFYPDQLKSTNAWRFNIEGSDHLGLMSDFELR